MMVAVWRATSPPPIRRTAATNPSMIAQNSLESTGGLGFPPEVMMSMTMEPESDEVTKKVTMTIMARLDVKEARGKFPSRMNRETGMFSCTAWDMPPAPNISIKRAVLPKMVIQINVINVGTSSTPATNWRMVRPWETRAMNMPTNGDHAIHHDQ